MLNGLVVFPTFFNLILIFTIRSSWSEPQSAPSLVFADCIELLHLWLKEYNQSDFSIDHLVMSMCRVFSCVVGKGCLLCPVRSFGKTLLALPCFILYSEGQICLLLQVMAPHSGTLAWRIPWTEEPGGLQSMRSLRVGHDWTTSLSLFTFMHRRRKWQPTPVFLPGESQGRQSLVGCHLWGCIESDTTEVTQQ